MGMSEIVKRAGLAHGCRDRRQPTTATEVAPSDRTPVRSREDEAGAVGVHRQMGGKHLDEEWRHANSSTRRLRLGPLLTAPIVGQRVVDGVPRSDPGGHHHEAACERIILVEWRTL